MLGFGLNNYRKPGAGGGGSAPVDPVDPTPAPVEETVVQEPVVTGELTITINKSQIQIGDSITTSENGNITLTRLVVAGYDILATIGQTHESDGLTIISAQENGVTTVIVETVGEQSVPVDIAYSDKLVIIEQVTREVYITTPLVISANAERIQVGEGLIQSNNSNIVLTELIVGGFDVLANIGVVHQVAQYRVESSLVDGLYTITITPLVTEPVISYSLKYTDEGPVQVEPEKIDPQFAMFDEPKIVVNRPTGGQNLGTFSVGEMVFAFHDFVATGTLSMQDSVSGLALLVGGGGGGGYQSTTMVAGGGGGAAVQVLPIELNAGASHTISIPGGGNASSSSSDTNGKGRDGASVVSLNLRMFGGGGGSCSNAAPGNSACASSGGKSASDLANANAGYLSAGFTGGTTSTLRLDPVAKLAGGGGGAGGWGGNASINNRKGGDAGPGQDVGKIFDFLGRTIFGCGAPGGALSIDGVPVTPGNAAPVGPEWNENGAPNSGNGGGPNKNGGSGRVVIVYRIA